MHILRKGCDDEHDVCDVCSKGNVDLLDVGTMFLCRECVARGLAKFDEPGHAHAFTHDCPKCRFLGHYVEITKGNAADWYHCPGILGGSIIGRYGDKPEEYWSSPVGVVMGAEVGFATSPFMRQAKKLIALHNLEWHREPQPEEEP